MINYFVRGHKYDDPSKLTIEPNLSAMPIARVVGSLRVLPAHLVGMDYANFLRMCRDEFGAKLIGREHLYVVPYWDGAAAIQLDNLLKWINSQIEKRYISARKS